MLLQAARTPGCADLLGLIVLSFIMMTSFVTNPVVYRVCVHQIQ